MPSASKKIATAIRSANRAIVNNYNAANRAVNRAPTWVKWTVGIVAVAVILYVLWKLMWSKKEEFTSGGFTYEEKSDTMVKFDYPGFAVFNTYNINHTESGMTGMTVPDAGGMPQYYDFGKDGNRPLELIERLERAAYFCNKTEKCSGFQLSPEGGVYYLGPKILSPDPGDLVTGSTGYKIFTKTATTGGAATVEVKPDDAQIGSVNHGSIIYDVPDFGMHSEHSLVVNTGGNFITKDECKSRINANGGARGGSWQPVPGRNDGKGICRDISWECVVNRNDGKSVKDGNKPCKDMFTPQITQLAGGTTWFKNSESAKQAHDEMMRLMQSRTVQLAIQPKEEEVKPEPDIMVRGATLFKDINIAGASTDIGNITVNEDTGVSACSKYTNEKGGHGFTLVPVDDTTYKCWAKQYFPDKLESASIQTGQGDTYIFSDMLDGDGAVPDIPNESDLNAYGGNSDVSPSSTRKTTFDNWLKKSKKVDISNDTFKIKVTNGTNNGYIIEENSKLGVGSGTVYTFKYDAQNSKILKGDDSSKSLFARPTGDLSSDTNTRVIVLSNESGLDQQYNTWIIERVAGKGINDVVIKNKNSSDVIYWNGSNPLNLYPGIKNTSDIFTLEAV
jgi:hypothetical protein